MNILLMLPNNLGDVIMATAVIEALHAKYNKSTIYFIVEKNFEAALLHNPDLCNIFLLPQKSIKQTILNRNDITTHSLAEGYRLFQKFLDEVTATSYDLFINLAQAPLYATIASLIPATEKRGMQMVGEGVEALPDIWSQYLFAIPFARRSNKLHVIDIYKFIAGVEDIPSQCRLYFQEDEREKAKSLLSSLEIDVTQKICFLQPGSAIRSKMWPTKHYITLAKKLLNEGWQLIITGAPDEADMADEIAANLLGKVVSLAGKTTFREVLTILSWGSAIVTGDTALMHAAAALNLKIYALFGSTSPLETGPYTENAQIFVSNSCPEIPCFKNSCKTYHCMESISPIEVANIITGDSSDAPLSTSIKQGVYQLTSNKTNIYYNNEYAVYMLSFMLHLEREVTLKEFEEMEQLHNLLEEICNLLEEYQRGKLEALSLYEEKRKNMADIGGVTTFLVALINIALNSIPLVDLSKAIDESHLTCKRVAQQIKITTKLQPKR